MSGLDINLKRLMQLARDDARTVEAPLGFATRIVAQADLQRASSSLALSRSLSVVNWLAALLLFAGVLYWEAQRRAPMAGEFTEAAQFVALNLSPEP